MSSLPYITAPGNIERALRAIQNAATPSRVSQDFVKTILKIPGGSGDQVTSFLKKVGFAAGDHTPTELYKQFRNPSTAGRAALEALRIGYGALYARNEYMHQLSDGELRGLIIEETGQSDSSSVVGLVFAAIKAIRKFADQAKSTSELVPLDAQASAQPQKRDESNEHNGREREGPVGINLGYTINLNLPATSDIGVFNAIFKSLKEHLLRQENE